MSGKRRKRRPRPAPANAPGPPPAPAPRRPAPDGRPPAPWGAFPLVELTVLVGLGLLVGGFFVHGTRGGVMLATGLALCSLGGLEVSIREHFAGYRSHTLLLSAAVGVAVLVGLSRFAPSLSATLRIGAAVAVFVAVAWILTRAFRRRSGLSFKLR